MMAKQDKEYIYSKAIKGSVFEIENANKGTAPEYCIISGNALHATTNSAVVAIVIPDDGVDNPFHVKFEIKAGGQTLKYMILLENMWNCAHAKLKKYKYHLCESVIDRIDKGVMNVFFGKQLYNLDQARSKIAEEEIKLRCRIEAEMSGKTFVDTSEESLVDEPVEMDLEDMSVKQLQNYYATQYQNKEQEQMEEIIFNPVIEEIPAPAPEKKEDRKPKAKKNAKIVNPRKNVYIVKDNEEIKKPKTSKKRLPESVKNKQAIDPKSALTVTELQKISKTRPKAKGGINGINRRDTIYKNPAEFLLDYKTMPRAEMLDKYHIVNHDSIYAMVAKCKKLCSHEELVALECAK